MGEGVGGILPIRVAGATCETDGCVGFGRETIGLTGPIDDGVEGSWKVEGELTPFEAATAFPV
jgi:hypothetical protein